MSGIPSSLLNQLRSTLLSCGPFSSDRELANIFVDARIHPWASQIPSSTNSIERVQSLIHFLYNKTNTQQQNALVLFINALQDHTNPSDACHERLVEMGNALTLWLNYDDGVKTDQKAFELDENQDKTPLKNPYIFGVPARGQGNFFGREAEVQRVFNTLNNAFGDQKQDLAILGPRRIGKSSLLYRLQDLLSPNDKFVPIFLDIQYINPKTERNLFVEMLAEIKDGYNKQQPDKKLPMLKTLEGEIVADLTPRTFKKDMERLNREIRAGKLPRLVLLIDEVEVLQDFGGQGILNWFRGLIQSMTGIIFIVSGSDGLYALTQDYGSPFFNIFKIMELSPLTDDAARQLIETPAQEIGLQIDADEVQTILQYAGNNPYFIQGIAHYLVEHLNEDGRHQATAADVQTVIQHSTHYLKGNLEYFWNGVSQIQRALLYRLAKSGQPQTAGTLLQQLPQIQTVLPNRQDQENAVKDLVRQQILKQQDSLYWFVALLFRDWVIANASEEEITIRTETQTTTTQVQVTYNTAAIRRLLTLALTDKDILNLTYDHFRPVSESISFGMDKNEVVSRLVDYVERNQQFEQLLSEVQRINPSHYASLEKDLIAIKPTTNESTETAVSKSIRRIELYNILEKHFDLEELASLCFLLDISLEDLPGATKSSKARELIQYAERHSMYEVLVEGIADLRPSAFS